MSKRLIAVLGAALLLLSLAVVSSGQETKKVTTVQTPEGTYTIVEYPVGKETVVTLTPVGITGATGTATILRDANGSTIKVNLTSLPNDVTALNLYALDPTGAVSLLGPIEITNGVGTFTATAPLSRFMLFASPEPTLTAYDTTTKIFFRSAIPTGLSVIPLSTPVGEQVAATVAPTSEYAVPMLGIPNFKKGDDTKLQINFAGAMEGARANIFIEPDKKTNRTQVKMRFHDLKEAPKNTTYVLWAVSPDNQFQNLGQIVNVKGRNEAEINSEVTFSDFGLFLTTEEVGTVKTIIKPVGHRVGIIQLVP
ncbi:MAG TPA: hypothetical protein VGQ72_15775 [Pyrinomonadaceae bacterium]|jgi:hypothetical protein|nr:hypothetical protein [Pyrinomonadaceae bacterium]